VGLSGRDADRAARSGLRGGRRRFLHLALTEEEARETGKRTDEEYAIVTVHALDAWEEGVNFIDRKSQFLAESIPTRFIEVSELYTDGVGPERPGVVRRIGGERAERRGDDRRPSRSRGREGERDRERDPDRDSEKDRERGQDQDRDRSPENERGRDRSRDRDRSRGRGRGGRERGHDERRREDDSRRRPERYEPARGPRSDDDGRRPREGQRDERRGRDDAARRRPDARHDRPAVPAREAPPVKSGTPTGEFGTGIFDPRSEKKRPEPGPKKPAPLPPSAPQREPALPERRDEEGGSSFGAGLD
jgi:hypothetical protein